MMRPVAALMLCLGCCGRAFGLDHVTFTRDDQRTQVDGQVLVNAQDGGMLLQARDGVLWALQPGEIVEHTTDEIPFEPLSAEELARQLLKELPRGFEAYPTRHYVICHRTSRAYAGWCASLFERLYMAFTNFWTRKGFELAEPEFPLVAIVFADKRSFVEFSRPEVGDAVESIIGYYSLRTNRMVMYDLTGYEALSPHRSRRGSSGISDFLRRPEATRIVATIVHEATHQIAFNCGLHTRYSDCPLWFSEGVAVYFETPDLGSAKGWRNIGAVNRPRLAQFRAYLRTRPADSLVTLLEDDKRLSDTQTAPDAYAEAWALTYFLIRMYPEKYVQYLRRLSQKKPLLYDDPQTRLAEFKQVFGEDLKSLDAEFVRYMTRRIR
jgi:hypothetical protein